VTDPSDNKPSNEPSVMRRRKPQDVAEGEGAGEATSEDANRDEVVAAPEISAAPPTPRPASARGAASRPKPVEDDVDFARFMEDQDDASENIEQGMIVAGQLVAVSGDWAFIDLGGKQEGILAVSEITDPDGKLTAAIGDRVEAFVVTIRAGEIQLSQALGRQIRDQESLFEAYQNRIPVEGRVTGTNKGGYEVRVGGHRGFCPMSQIDVVSSEEPAAHVGRTYRFRITEMTADGKRLVVSRAQLLREELATKRQQRFAELEPGQELEGVVSSLHDYGAFVDLGGVDGLIHVSELSWTRVEHPSEVVKVGDHVTVKLLDIKKGEKGQKLSLSLRQTAPHPWIAVGTKFVEGETYRGTVTRLEPYGAFVELGPGIEGLIHISELSWERRIKHPNEVLTVGLPVDVYLKGIDYDRNRIALSLKALQKDPWTDAAERYPAGTEVSGTVEKVQPFGVFVQLEPGLVGLIPASESNTGTGQDLRKNFQPGQAVKGTVLSVDPEKRRLSISLKAGEVARDEKEIRQYMDEQKKQQGGKGLGTLGDLFAHKLH
jgi:small subunit ribosomal protein S1